MDGHLKLIAIGHVANTPIFLTDAKGNELARFNLGVSRGYKDKATQENKTFTSHYTVVVEGKFNVPYVKEHLSEGSCILLDATLRSQKTQTGSIEVVIQVGPYDGRIVLLNETDTIAKPAPSSYDIPY